MKTKAQTPKKRDTKALEKIKEEGEGDTNLSVQMETTHGKPTIEDLITCQICKDPVVKDHRMCPRCCIIWCTECIEPVFKSKTAKCPNCRNTIYKKSLKKSPLFEKLKEMLKEPETPVVQQHLGCEVHGQPEDFYCKD